MNKSKLLKTEDRTKPAWMFDDYRPNTIIDSILEGHLGSVIVDDEQNPHIAQLAFADIIVLGGDPGHPATEILVKDLPDSKAILPSNRDWAELISRNHADRLIKLTRQRFSGEKLSASHLRKLLMAIPPKYRLNRIDIDLARIIRADKDLISEDHVHNYDSPEDFVKRGVGFCILDGDRIVSGASSYSFCDKGIEVQVNTNPEFRKQGLATAVSAALIIHCLENDMEPNWDAGNETSIKLALKLGYIKADTYEALLIE